MLAAIATTNSSTTITTTAATTTTIIILIRSPRLAGSMGGAQTTKCSRCQLVSFPQTDDGDDDKGDGNGDDDDDGNISEDIPIIQSARMAPVKIKTPERMFKQEKKRR
jgi:hypothetical protein